MATKRSTKKADSITLIWKLRDGDAWVSVIDDSAGGRQWEWRERDLPGFYDFLRAFVGCRLHFFTKSMEFGTAYKASRRGRKKGAKSSWRRLLGEMHERELKNSGKTLGTRRALSEIKKMAEKGHPIFKRVDRDALYVLEKGREKRITRASFTVANSREAKAATSITMILRRARHVAKPASGS